MGLEKVFEKIGKSKIALGLMGILALGPNQTVNAGGLNLKWDYQFFEKSYHSSIGDLAIYDTPFSQPNQFYNYVLIEKNAVVYLFTSRADGLPVRFNEDSMEIDQPYVKILLEKSGGKVARVTIDNKGNKSTYTSNPLDASVIKQGQNLFDKYFNDIQKIKSQEALDVLTPNQ